MTTRYMHLVDGEPVSAIRLQSIILEVQMAGRAPQRVLRLITLCQEEARLKQVAQFEQHLTELTTAHEAFKAKQGKPAKPQ